MLTDSSKLSWDPNGFRGPGDMSTTTSEGNYSLAADILASAGLDEAEANDFEMYQMASAVTSPREAAERQKPMRVGAPLAQLESTSQVGSESPAGHRRQSVVASAASTAAAHAAAVLPQGVNFMDQCRIAREQQNQIADGGSRQGPTPTEPKSSPGRRVRFETDTLPPPPPSPLGFQPPTNDAAGLRAGKAAQLDARSPVPSPSGAHGQPARHTYEKLRLAKPSDSGGVQQHPHTIDPTSGYHSLQQLPPASSAGAGPIYETTEDMESLSSGESGDDTYPLASGTATTTGLGFGEFGSASTGIPGAGGIERSSRMNVAQHSDTYDDATWHSGLTLKRRAKQG